MIPSIISAINFKALKWNEKVNHPNGVEYRLWEDGEDYFCKYTITKPKGMISDLEQCKKDLGWASRINTALKFIKGSKKFLDEKIYGIIGTGGLTTVFDIGDDRVLKISEENPFEYRKYNPKFDIPLVGEVEHFDGIYGYIQKKADTENVGLKNVLSVKRKMKRAGYTSSQDFGMHRVDQVGVYKGKSLLLDSRCAVRRNNFITRFTRWFKDNFNFKRVYYAYRIEDIMDRPPTHIEEKPLPNYTLKEAFGRIKKVIKSWK